MFSSCTKKKVSDGVCLLSKTGPSTIPSWRKYRDPQAWKLRWSLTSCRLRRVSQRALGIRMMRMHQGAAIMSSLCRMQKGVIFLHPWVLFEMMKLLLHNQNPPLLPKMHNKIVVQKRCRLPQNRTKWLIIGELVGNMTAYPVVIIAHAGGE